MKQFLEVLAKVFHLVKSFFDSGPREPIDEVTDQSAKPATFVSQHCIDIIKYYEQFRANTYLDPVGIPTIGYGDTGPHVQMGQVITEAEANRRLMDRLGKEFVPGVLGALKVTPPVEHLDAMVSLAYNIGVGAFRNSTLVKLYNKGDVDGAMEQFARWHFSNKVSLKGLRRRRRTEQERYKGKTAKEAIRIGLTVE